MSLASTSHVALIYRPPEMFLVSVQEASYRYEDITDSKSFLSVRQLASRSCV